MNKGKPGIFKKSDTMDGSRPEDKRKKMKEQNLPRIFLTCNADMVAN